MHIVRSFLAALLVIPFIPACQSANIVISPYVQRPGPTEMTIRWSSDEAAPFTVRYGQGDKLDQEMSVTGPVRQATWTLPAPGTDPAVLTTNVEYLYASVLSNLHSGTEYRYQVGADKAAPGGHFQTVPEKPGAFTFIAYGDTRSVPTAHRKIASQFLAQKPAFILHTGDLVSSAKHTYWKPEFFDPLADVISSVPIWPAIGNHDGDYRRYFSLPNNGLWYSFDYGNAHFVCLEVYGKKDQMPDWCEKDLAASKAAWKFVYLHFPSYDVGKHGTGWGRKDYLPLFRKYGVDIVFSGHSHSYQRWKPMYTKGENEDHPITHIVAAGGGAPLSFVQQDPYLAVGARDLNFTVVNIDGDTLTARTLNGSGTEIDSLTIRKKNGKPDAAYLAQALPEENWGALRDRVAPSLRGLTLAGPIREGKPAPLRFALGAGDKAMKYEFKMETQSAKDYAVTPASGRIDAGKTKDIELSIRLKKPELYKPDERLALIRLECVFEIDGQTASIVRDIREMPAPAQKPAKTGDDS